MLQELNLHEVIADLLVWISVSRGRVETRVERVIGGASVPASRGEIRYLAAL